MTGDIFSQPSRGQPIRRAVFRRRVVAGVALVAVSVVAAALTLGAGGGGSATASATATPAASDTPTATSTPEATATHTAVAPTWTPVPPEPTATATNAPIVSPTVAPQAPVPTAVATAVAPPPAPPAGRPAWTLDQLRSPLRRGDGSRPVVYLTFDDGWGYVDEIRTILEEKGASATACLVGQYVEGHPGEVQRWAAAGFSFCNHSYSHTDLTAAPLLWSQVGGMTLSDELLRTEQLLAQVAPGATMAPFFRPPFGSENATVREAAASLGYRVMLWSIDTRDWSAGTTAQSIRDHVVGSAVAGDIVLLHFTRYATVEALPGIIDGLRARGFSLEGLEGLSGAE
jgi:peptidoglycan-N-acetylglucosamine deacetylase